MQSYRSAKPPPEKTDGGSVIMKSIILIIRLPLLLCEICEMLRADISHQRAGLVFLRVVISKAAFFLTAFRFFVSVIIAAPHRRASKLLKSIFLQPAHRLGDISVSPKRNSYPIACFNLGFSRFCVRLCGRDKPYAAYGSVILFQADRIGFGRREHGFDYFSAVFNAGMHGPARNRPDQGIFGIFI